MNARSTAASEELTQRVLADVGARAASLERLDTAGPGTTVEQVEAAVRDRDPDLVVAVGGDGTVRAVAEGIARAGGVWDRGPSNGGPSLLVVPAGSGNSAFATLWGDTERDRAVAEALTSPCVRHADLIRLRELDRGSFLGVNLGLVARVAEAVERMKRARELAESAEARYWGAFGEVLQDLRPFPVRVLVDGKPLHDGIASMITVGGVRNFGQGRFRLLPRAVIDDGRLDVCVVAAETAEEIGALAALVGTGEHVGQPGVHYAQGRIVAIERPDGEPLTVEHDGDPVPAPSALTLEAVPAAVALLAAEASPTERG